MKYPRTLHLPFSPGASSDDKILESVDSFLNREIIITEKLDGSNCCLTKDNVFARSHATPARHPSFNWIKQKQFEIGYQLQDEMIFGENCYAIHSIEYDGLPSYFFAFGIFSKGVWLDWDSVKTQAEALGLATAPELGRYTFKSLRELQTTVEALCAQSSIYGGSREGVVLRVSESFSEEDFSKNVCKWVRKDHVQTDDHWMFQTIRPQKLKKD